MQVSDTTLQGGRLSVSTSDMTFKDMAGHCEALQAGKQQKMSHLMIAQASQENSLDFFRQDFIQANMKPANNCDNAQSPVSIKEMCLSYSFVIFVFEHHFHKILKDVVFKPGILWRVLLSIILLFYYKGGNSIYPFFLSRKIHLAVFKKEP